MELHIKIGEWASSEHHNTKHRYGGYLPYQFHLEMVVGNAMRYIELEVPKNEFPDGDFGNIPRDNIRSVIYSGCWCHDLIEDARINYNDIFTVVKLYIMNSLKYTDADKSARQVADIVYAVTNEKGKNRHERESDKYFEGIRNTEHATFVKLCDLLANIEYSKMTAWKNSGKLEMYRKEHARFKEQLYSDKYLLMFNRMDSILR